MTTQTRQCPSCAETIDGGAIKCPHCHEELNAPKADEVRKLIQAGQPNLARTQCPRCAETIVHGGEFCPFCKESPVSAHEPSTLGNQPPAALASGSDPRLHGIREGRRRNVILACAVISIGAAIALTVILFRDSTGGGLGPFNLSMTAEDVNRLGVGGITCSVRGRMTPRPRWWCWYECCARNGLSCDLTKVTTLTPGISGVVQVSTKQVEASAGEDCSGTAIQKQLANLAISHIKVEPTTFDDDASAQWYKKTAAAMKREYGTPTGEEEHADSAATLTWTTPEASITLEGGGLDAHAR